jgi:hypothetical protein
MNTYSGYTPKNDVERFNSEVEKVTKLIREHGFTGITFKHDGYDIEVSLVNGDRHIDNVMGIYPMNF